MVINKIVCIFASLFVRKSVVLCALFVRKNVLICRLFVNKSVVLIWKDLYIKNLSTERLILSESHWY